MIAFDSDIFTELILKNPKYLSRARAYSLTDQRLPVVTACEVIRGQIKTVARAESPNSKLSLVTAHGYLERTLRAVAKLELLPFTTNAETIFQQLKQIPIGSNDKRIAAICIDHNIRLVTRNARDFQQVPGLQLEVWP